MRGRLMAVALSLGAVQLAGCTSVPRAPQPLLPAGASEAALLAAAPAADWQAIPPEDLLVLDWKDHASGTDRRVIVRLLAVPGAAPWLANLRALARAGYWRDSAIYRVVPNFVAQWGVPPNADARQSTTEPDYVTKVLPGSFVVALDKRFAASANRCHRGDTGLHGLCDAFAPQVRLIDGWVFGSDGRTMWPLACRRMVGVARALAPDQGSGAALFAILGNDARYLDRNIGIVGRVIAGFEHLATLPGGSGEQGVYAGPQVPQAFTRVALASELPEQERPQFRYLRPGTASHEAVLALRLRADNFVQSPYPVLSACSDLVPIVPVPRGNE